MPASSKIPIMLPSFFWSAFNAENVVSHSFLHSSFESWTYCAMSWRAPGPLLVRSWPTPDTQLAHSWSAPGPLLVRTRPRSGTLLPTACALLAQTPGVALGVILAGAGTPQLLSAHCLPTEPQARSKADVTPRRTNAARWPPRHACNHPQRTPGTLLAAPGALLVASGRP